MGEGLLMKYTSSSSPPVKRWKPSVVPAMVPWQEDHGVELIRLYDVFREQGLTGGAAVKPLDRGTWLKSALLIWDPEAYQTAQWWQHLQTPAPSAENDPGVYLSVVIGWKGRTSCLRVTGAEWGLLQMWEQRHSEKEERERFSLYNIYLSITFMLILGNQFIFTFTQMCFLSHWAPSTWNYYCWITS